VYYQLYIDSNNIFELVECIDDNFFSFYLLKDDGSTMTFLAYDQIEITTNNPKQTVSAEGVFFVGDGFNILVWN